MQYTRLMSSWVEFMKFEGKEGVLPVATNGNVTVDILRTGIGY